MITISSQRYLDDDVVAEKLANEDFVVSVSPWFEHDGLTMRVVLDGHHSLAAAKEAGVSPEYVELDSQDSDKIGLIDRGEFDLFLESAWMDSDYYDIETGVCVW